MKTRETPLVTLDGLSDLNLPAAMQIPKTRAEMLKSGWLEWLEKHKQFRLELPEGKFTAYKSAKGYWTAQRRVNGKLRHEYLGSTNDLTYETLDQAARKMNMDDSTYWREKYPDLRVEQSHNEKYETVSESSLQVTAEIEDLKRQLAEAKKVITDSEHRVRQETKRADDAVLNGLNAATILHQALKLKANAGGAIKTKIKEALKFIDDI